MTPAERAVIEAAMAWTSVLDDADATRTLIDACSVLDNERATAFIDGDGDVWTRRENGKYSLAGQTGFATPKYIRKYYGEQL